MDFGCLLADPIMQHTVVKQLFFSSRRYGRFPLHSGRYDACAIRLNIAFFHVFWFPTNCIPIRQAAFFQFFWTANRSTKTRTFQNGSKRATRKTHAKSQHTTEFGKTTARIADDWSTRFGLSKNCAKFGKSFQIAIKICDFSHEKNEPK